MAAPTSSHHTSVNLAPGDLVMARSPLILGTILGSCVAVTMRDPKTGYAGMCHAMLPEQRAGAGVAGSFRYLDRALDHMVEWFVARGVAPRSLEVKVFGGADVLATAGSGAGAPPTIGAMNREALARLLGEHGLIPVSSSLGGCSGLKLYFDTGTGDVLVRRLHKTCKTSRDGRWRG